MHDPAGFGDIILRATSDGGHVRVRDVGRVELGAEDYSGSIWYNGANFLGIAIGTCFRFYSYRRWVWKAPLDEVLEGHESLEPAGAGGDSWARASCTPISDTLFH